MMIWSSDIPAMLSPGFPPLPRSSDLAIKHPERLRVAAVTRHDQQYQHHPDTLLSDSLLIVRHDRLMQQWAKANIDKYEASVSIYDQSEASTRNIDQSEESTRNIDQWWASNRGQWMRKYWF